MFFFLWQILTFSTTRCFSYSMSSATAGDCSTFTTTRSSVSWEATSLSRRTNRWALTTWAHLTPRPCHSYWLWMYREHSACFSRGYSLTTGSHSYLLGLKAVVKGMHAEKTSIVRCYPVTHRVSAPTCKSLRRKCVVYTVVDPGVYFYRYMSLNVVLCVF